MSGESEALAGQREAILGQIRAQRQEMAAQLAPATLVRSGFPRSFTMRLLSERPQLLAGLFSMLLGARYARTIPLLLAAAYGLRLAMTARSVTALPVRPSSLDQPRADRPK